MPATQTALEACVGRHGVLDAAGVVAMFVSISRIVDTTGHKSTAIAVVATGTTAISFVRGNWPVFAAAAVASVSFLVMTVF